MTEMQYTQSGENLTEQFEGLRLSAYLDSVGVPTIGYGHTKGVSMGMTCTQDQANQWLLEDVQTAVNAVNRLVTIQLTQNEFNALVDFVFNLGEGNFESSTLLKDLNAGNFEACIEQFQVWDHAGGKEVAGLLRRRLAEAGEFSTPDSANA